MIYSYSYLSSTGHSKTRVWRAKASSHQNAESGTDTHYPPQDGNNAVRQTEAVS